MTMLGRLPARALLAVPVVLLALAAGPGTAGASQSDSQTLLNGTGVTTTFSPQDLTCPCSGYWIWSEPGGTNSYGVPGGNGGGNMYLYALGYQNPVDVSNVVISSVAGGSNNHLSETVTWTKLQITCYFWATESSPGHGSISFSCDNVPVPAKDGGGTTNVTSTDAPASVTISNFGG